MRFYQILFFGFVLTLVSLKTQGQKLDNIIRYHKAFQLDSLKEELVAFEPEKLRFLFEYDLAYLTTGKIVPSSSISLNGLKGRNRYVGRYLLGDLMQRSNRDRDSIVFSLYFDSLNESEDSGDSLVVNEVLERINRLLFTNGKQQESLKANLEKHQKYAQDSIDMFYVNYHKIGYELLNIEDINSVIDTTRIEMNFKEAKKYATSPFLRGSLYGYESIFYSAYLDRQRLGYDLNQMALSELDGINYHFAEYVSNGIAFNNAIILYEEGRFQDAIPIFKRLLKTESQLVYRMHGYDWLHKCYDSLGDYGNAYRYFKKVGEVKDSLSLLEHAREIKAIEARYDFDEKELELEQLANEKNRVQTNLNTLIPFFGIAIVLALIALYLYRKYRRRSELLQEEKTETLKRIDQLKKIVIKNHIILKDKTKVYVSDLMYIKAEDHYLKLYLSNGKDHLVRGKIKDIKQQLPPNFIQCHRSYIVNANFIKQSNRDNLIMISGDSVPLSRTYKGRF